MARFSDERFRSEWRALGYHYDLDHDAKRWVLDGTRQGLKGFATTVREYAVDAEHDWVSCQCHLGPYDYLQIGTWASPVIDDHWIAGSLSELLDLAAHMLARLEEAEAGDCISLRSFFSPSSPYDLCLNLMPDDFDPASLDTSLAP